MDFTDADLQRYTRETFPSINGSVILLEPILKGGSDRRYYRVTMEDGAHHQLQHHSWPVNSAVPSLILMVYTPNRPDNLRFAPITSMLERLGAAVPRIYYHDEEMRLMWLEDLGVDDLWSYRDQPWEVRRSLYQKALSTVSILHKTKAEALREEEAWEMEPPFDAKLYFWEQEYFVEHFVTHFTTLSQKDCHELLHGEFFQTLRETLAALPRCLVHRDFQSQNLMVRDGKVFLIDYQGVRHGIGSYDTASLLYDPYVSLTAGEREELLDYYAKVMEITEPKAFQHHFALASTQRLMQALGAYGNLGRNHKKPEFFRHIPAALNNLSEVVKRDSFLDPLRKVLDAVKVS